MLWFLTPSFPRMFPQGSMFAPRREVARLFTANIRGANRDYPGAYFTKEQDTDFCAQESYFSGISLVLHENLTVSAHPVLFG